MYSVLTRRKSCLYFSTLSLFVIESGLCYAQSVTPAAPTRISGIEVNYIDRSIHPQDDFFHYANGGWLKTAVIPNDKARIGALSTINDLSEKAQKTILDDLRGSSPVRGSDRYKAKIFLETLLDKDFYSANDLAFVKNDLDLITNAKTHAELAGVMGQFSRHSAINSPFPIQIQKDQKDVQKKTAYIGSARVTLGRFDNYWKNTPEAVAKRQALKDMYQSLLNALAYEDSEDRANKVVTYEAALASILGKHWSWSRDLKKEYYPLKISKLNKKYKGFDWERYLTAMGFKEDETVVLRSKKITKGLATLFASTDLQALKDHLTLSYLRMQSNYLPQNIEMPVENFLNSTLTGQKERTPLEKQSYNLTSASFASVIGQDYVKRYTTDKTRETVRDLVENIRNVFAKAIEQNNWMDRETKAEAQAKLSKVEDKIGFPDTWQTYSNINVDVKYALNTIRSIRSNKWQKDLGELRGNKPTTEEWRIPVYTAGAFYNPQENEIIIPAGFLQSPIFDANADDAANYGAIGMVIGHELGHAFDNRGRQRAGDGSDRDWWSGSSEKRFKKKSEKLIKQFETYEVFPNEAINGRRTLGENIGDLTGIKIAYDAYQKSLKGKDAPIIDGFTGDQRFFLAYAQLWRSKWTETLKRSAYELDSHSPNQYRVNGILRNFDPWYKAFNVTPENALYLPPGDRISIW